VQTLRFILNTFYSGPQAWFFVADDEGFLREEGIALEFVEGDTLANAVPRIERGEFELGYGDLNALVELAAQSALPHTRAVYAVHNASPYTIAVPAESNIKTLHDLHGKRVATHPNDAAWRMLPELALASSLEAQRLSIDTTPVPHKDMVRDMVERGTWDAMFGFVNTLNAAAIEAGLRPHALRHFEYRDHVPQLYGAALMVRDTLITRAPDLVHGLVRAVNRGIRAVIADPHRAIDAVARRNPALDKPANLARLTGTLALEMAHAESAILGLGCIEAQRLQSAATLITRAKGYPRIPDANEIFDAQFLPPKEERIYSLARVMQ
jgi:NitT/TauT family transport system substrate-binding protein